MKVTYLIIHLRTKFFTYRNAFLTFKDMYVKMNNKKQKIKLFWIVLPGSTGVNKISNKYKYIIVLKFWHYIFCTRRCIKIDTK